MKRVLNGLFTRCVPTLDFKTGAFVRELAEPCDSVWRAVFRDDKCVTLSQRDGKTLLHVRTFRPTEDELHGPQQ